jgi:translation initiation factor 4A
MSKEGLFLDNDRGWNRESDNNSKKVTDYRNSSNLPVEDNYDPSYEISNWDDLEISSDLLRGIYGYGLEKPSPIQCKSIVPILQKKDIIAQAQSGTGKTASFTVGALSRINLEEQTTQILVLSPTRELSVQIADVMRNIGALMTGLRVKLLVGGTSIEEDIHDLKNIVPHVVVGCTGRIYDMIRRNHLKSSTIQMVILDEADEMLASGFKEQVYNIFQYFSPTVQVVLFSATMPEYMRHITGKFMRNPVKVSVKAESLTLEGIQQYFVAVEDDKQKYATLKDLYSFMSVSQCIIYCNSVKRVSDLYDAMISDGFPVCCIHSNMDKSARDAAFADFRNGKYRVLISSNVTARGIDIQQVSCVINFDCSKCIHTYLHRIGRSGRWGRKGVGINFITRRDVAKIREIEQFYCTQISELPANFQSV